MPDPIPFALDRTHASYDPVWVNRFWRALVSVDAVMKAHRARFRGKASPVQLFWGSFDLSYSRFSGRSVEPPPGADVIVRHSADAEVASFGFWPGNAMLPEASFFAYTAPKPAGIEEAAVGPEAARWSPEVGEFLLPYEAVRAADDPTGALLVFLETTHRAGAELANWSNRVRSSMFQYWNMEDLTPFSRSACGSSRESRSAT